MDAGPGNFLAAHRKFLKNFIGVRGKYENYFSANLYMHAPANRNYSKPLKKPQKPKILRRDRDRGAPRAFAGSFSQKLTLHMCQNLMPLKRF